MHFQYIFYSKSMQRKVNLKLLSKYLNDSSQVVVRADFNVPIKDGKILDLNRVKTNPLLYLGTIPTLQYLASHNPKSIVLLSHLGRPNGQVNPKFSLQSVVAPLEQMLGRPVNFINNCVGEGVVNRINSSEGEIFLC